jgi:hypothetical protein
LTLIPAPSIGKSVLRTNSEHGVTIIATWSTDVNGSTCVTVGSLFAVASGRSNGYCIDAVQIALEIDVLSFCKRISGSKDEHSALPKPANRYTVHQS